MTLDQLAKRLQHGTDQQMLRDTCDALARDPAGAVILAGYWCQTSNSFGRQIVPLAFRGSVDRSDAWIPWTTWLLPPYSTDRTTLLNIFSALAEEGAWAQRTAASPAPALLGGFLRHVLTLEHLIAERAVDMLALLPGNVLAAIPGEVFEDLVATAGTYLAAVDDQIVKAELEQCLLDAQTARTGATPPPKATTNRLRAYLEEAEERLGSNSALEVAKPALKRLEAYLAGPIRDHEVPVVQSVRFRSSKKTEHVLDDRRVGAGFRAWSMFNEWWIPTLSQVGAKTIPATAMTGSFRVDLVVGTKGVEAEAVLKGADHLAELISDETPLQDAEPWRRLVDVLAEFGLAVTVTHYWGTRESKTVELSPMSMKAVRRRIASDATARVSSIDVPQANVIEKVFRIAELISQAEAVTAEALGIDPRDFNYYRRAAKILGLINDDDEMTPAGRQIARLTGADQLRIASVLFEASSVGDAWIAHCGAASLVGVAPETAEDFLSQRTTVTGTTIPRRAATLKAWYNALIPFHYSQ